MLDNRDESKTVADVEKKDSDEEELKSENSEKGGDVKVTFGLEMLFLFIGTNILFSYNTFLNGVDFYKALLNRPEIDFEMTRVLIVSSEVFNLCMLPFIERFTLRFRLYVSLTSMACVQVIVFFYVNLASKPSYIVIYILAAGTSLTQSVMFGSSMGFAGLFGDKTSAMANTGVAIGGLVTSILRMISKAAWPNSLKSQGWFYLFWPLAMNFGTVLAFHLFQRTDVCQERMKLAKTSNDFFIRLKRIKGVFMKIWVIVIVALMNMAITLTFFPGYCFQVGDHHNLGDWYITVILFCFMVGDVAGRLIARWALWPAPKYLWIPHVCRLLFIPLYVLPIENVIKPLKDDIYVDILTFILAVTGGYFGGLCITYTAINEKFEKDEIDLGVFTVVVATNMGVLLGTLLTFLTQLHKN